MGTDKELSDLLDFSMVSWARLPPRLPHPQGFWEGGTRQSTSSARPHICLDGGAPGGAGRVGVPSDGHADFVASGLTSSKGTWHLGVCSGTEWVLLTALQMGKLRPKEQLSARLWAQRL